MEKLFFFACLFLTVGCGGLCSFEGCPGVPFGTSPPPGGNGPSSTSAFPTFVVDEAVNPARGPSYQVNTIVPLTDGTGRIYVGGEFTAYTNQIASGIIRLLSSGQIDLAFQTNNGFNGAVNSIVPLYDGTGRIYVGGSFTSYNGTTTGGVIRLNSDGSIDTTFNPGGAGFNVVESMTYYMPGDYQINTVNALLLDPNATGDLYVTGKFDHYNGAAIGPCLARLTSTGALRSNFVTGTGLTSSSFTQGAILLPDTANGDVYVGGTFSAYNGTSVGGLFRVGPTGALDASFNPGGSGTSGNILAGTVDGSGNLYLGGYVSSFNSSSVENLFELNSAGTVINAYGGAGVANSGVLSPFVHSLVFDASGRLYVGGVFSSFEGTNVPRNLLRLTSGGALDAGFATGSGIGPNSYSNQETILCAAIATDGSGDLLAGGTFDTYNGAGITNLALIAPSGAAVGAFNHGSGLSPYTFGALSHTDNLALVPDGSGEVYVNVGEQGYSSYNGAAVGAVFKLTDDGSIDGAYNQVTVTDAGVAGAAVYALSAASDGSTDLYVGGTFDSVQGTSSYVVARLTNSGAVNPSFTSGFSTTCGLNLGPTCPLVYGFLPLTDGTGDLYMWGRFSSYGGSANMLTRITANGALAGFNSGQSGPDSEVQSVTSLSDGSLYAAGSFSHYNGTAVPGLAHVFSDGSLDTSFNSGGAGASGGSINSLLTAPGGSGAVYLGGTFTSYNGVTAYGLARVTSTGALDTSFNLGLPSGSTTVLIASPTDGTTDIYVSGNYTTYLGAAVSDFLRLDDKGNLVASFPFSAPVDSILPVPAGEGAFYAVGGFYAFGGTTASEFALISPP